MVDRRHIRERGLEPLSKKRAQPLVCPIQEQIDGGHRPFGERLCGTDARLEPKNLDGSMTLHHQSLPNVSGNPDLAKIVFDETVLMLIAQPGEEASACGGLIRECCERGRPPFVVIVTDGTSTTNEAEAVPQQAQRRERETRRALGLLGVPRDRMLMVGIFSGTVPQAGALFGAMMDAVVFLTWRYDCNAICAPCPSGTDDHRAVNLVGKAVADAIQAPLISYPVYTLVESPVAIDAPDDGCPLYLDTEVHLPVKIQAMEVHGPSSTPIGQETYFVQRFRSKTN
jgi:LmbE family N-acetylglucosaminyl deacetylase